jgi:serine phosphatase RsbU (regulator of sigma subunit)
MVMSMAKKILSMQIKIHKDPGEALKETNAELIPDLDSKTFVSVFIGILDTEERTLCFARGGHSPLIVFNPMRSPRLQQYEPPGMVLGMAKPEIFNRVLKVETIQLAPGDVLFQYTDGVTEASDEAKEEFSVERLCELVEKHGEKEMEYLLFQINKALAEFRGRAKIDDDVTMVGIKII